MREAYNNMGIALQEQGQAGRGDRGLQQSPTIKPDYADAYNNMGNALKEQGQAGRGDRGLQQSLSSSSLIT